MISTKPTTVSVIIPTYNRADYLAEALESVQADCDDCTEILVVDDGSTDETPRVVAGFRPRVRYLWQANAGPGHARNTGTAATSGEYIVFLDSDDLLLTGGLGAGRAALDSGRAAAFAFGRYRTTSAGVIRSITSEAHDRFDPEAPFRSMLQGNLVGIMSNVMFRRSALVDVGGFDPAYSFCADYELYLRLSRRFAVIRHDAYVAEYRMHSGNRSAQSVAVLETALAILSAQRAYVREDPDLLRALRRGQRGWVDFYGGRLLDGCRAAISERRWTVAAGQAAAMIRACGARTPAVIALQLLPASLRAALRNARSMAR
jgi:glycosyltransferase involved in cell wall biosynthesis